jgi:hypothetical protein
MSTAPQYVGRAVGLAFATAVICGVGGAFVGEPVISGLGNLVNHHELVLRTLGWCWGGLPFVVLVTAYSQRHRLRPQTKRGLTYAVAVWAASGALLLPGRRSTLEERFGGAYLDAQPLGFGWAAGFLALVALGFLVALLIIGWGKLTGTATKQSLVGLSRAITSLWALLTAAGLLAALVAPLPY